MDINARTIYDYINVLKELRMCNISSNNKFSVVTIEKWQEYQIEELKSNNNATTRFFEVNDNKIKHQTVEKTEFNDNEKNFSNNKCGNNNFNNKKTSQVFENKVIEGNVETKTNNNFNNNVTTTQHKQECKEYYINLFNKYKEQNRKRFKSKNEIFKRTKRKRKHFRKRRRRIKRIDSRG